MGQVQEPAAHLAEPLRPLPGVLSDWAESMPVAQAAPARAEKPKVAQAALPAAAGMVAPGAAVP